MIFAEGFDFLLLGGIVDNPSAISDFICQGMGRVEGKGYLDAVGLDESIKLLAGNGDVCFAQVHFLVR